jgi:hypothetical protein
MNVSRHEMINLFISVSNNLNCAKIKLKLSKNHQSNPKKNSNLPRRHAGGPKRSTLTCHGPISMI